MKLLNKTLSELSLPRTHFYKREEGFPGNRGEKCCGVRVPWCVSLLLHFLTLCSRRLLTFLGLSRLVSTMAMLTTAASLCCEDLVSVLNVLEQDPAQTVVTSLSAVSLAMFSYQKTTVT